MNLDTKRKPRSRITVIGQLGTTLDKGKGEKRWNRWRPTLGICMQADLIIDRFELLYPPRYAHLAERVAQDIQQASPETEVRTHPLHYDDAWDFEAVYSALLDWVQHYSFNENDDYLVHITTGTHVSQICLFLLMEAKFLPGRIIQSQPGVKTHGPVGDYKLIDLDLSRYDQIWSRFEARKRASTQLLKGGVQTLNPQFNALIDELEWVSTRSSAPILLTGPTGVGKSRLARLLYQLKKQRHLLKGDLVEVNCATLRGDGAMSALFGHQRGAFTGAIAKRRGLIKAADGGLLFLDEIGELGLDEQAMLLHAIEDKRFLPIGSEEAVYSDFQLICGTNRDLKEAVEAGKFREDLYARINLWLFELPSLQERREDIAPNLEFERAKFATAHQRALEFNASAKKRYLEFATSPQASWPGNFRDLNGSVMRMATLSRGTRIDLATVEREIRRLQTRWQSTQPKNAIQLLDYLSPEAIERMDHFDRVQLESVLAICKRSRNLSEAGRMLFQYSRNQRKNPNDADRLRKYLKRFQLTWSEIHPKSSL